MTATALPARYVLRHCSVVAGDGLDIIDDAYLAVQDGKIAAVGSATDAPSLPTWDLAGKLVLPGFINSHTHIEDCGFKELPFGVPATVNLLFEPDGLRHVRIRERGRERLVEDIRLAVKQMISSGIVAFADYRTGGKAGAQILRDAVAGTAITCLIYSGHSRLPVQSAQVLEANKAGLDKAQLDDINAALDVADGFAPVWVNDVTDPALEQIRDLVRGRGKRLSTHSAASPNYREISIRRTGRSDIDRVIEHLGPDFVVHMTVATTEEIAKIVDAGIPIAMCPSTMAALGRRIPPYREARALGAIIGLGNDNAMTTRPDLLAEVGFLSRVVRSMAGDPSVVDAKELLASITRDAARVLQLDDVLGTVAPGKNASFVVMDMDSPNLRGSVNRLASVVSRAIVSDIAAVVIDGKIASGQIKNK